MATLAPPSWKPVKIHVIAGSHQQSESARRECGRPPAEWLYLGDHSALMRLRGTEHPLVLFCGSWRSAWSRSMNSEMLEAELSLCEAVLVTLDDVAVAGSTRAAECVRDGRGWGRVPSLVGSGVVGGASVRITAERREGPGWTWDGAPLVVGEDGSIRGHLAGGHLAGGGFVGVGEPGSVAPIAPAGFPPARGPRGPVGFPPMPGPGLDPDPEPLLTDGVMPADLVSGAASGDIDPDMLVGQLLFYGRVLTLPAEVAADVVSGVVTCLSCGSVSEIPMWARVIGGTVDATASGGSLLVSRASSPLAVRALCAECGGMGRGWPVDEDGTISSHVTLCAGMPCPTCEGVCVACEGAEPPVVGVVTAEVVPVIRDILREGRAVYVSPRHGAGIDGIWLHGAGADGSGGSGALEIAPGAMSECLGPWEKSEWAWLLTGPVELV